MKYDMKKNNLTVPNLLSLIRIILIVPFVILFRREEYLFAGIVILVSALSDMFDGAIARNFNQVTQLGKLLDPIADKLTLIAVVICIYEFFPYVSVLVVMLFCKEMLMLCGGALLLKLKIKPPAAKWYGKAATVVFYICVTLIVMLKAIWGIKAPELTTILLAVTTFAMIFALVNYALLFLHLIRERREGSFQSKEIKCSGDDKDRE